MSTLSASALALLFAASQFRGGIEGASWGIALFGLSLVVSLVGMRDALVSDWVSGTNARAASTSASGYFLTALTTFIGGVLLLIVYPALTSGLGD